MSITLQALEAALFDRLTALRADGAALTPAVPFRSLERWFRRVTPETFDEAFVGACPGAILVNDGSDTITRNDLEYVETLGHDVEVAIRHSFSVYAAVVDTRGDEAMVLGGVGTPSILACIQAVEEALAGLRIPGLLGGGVVHLAGHRPFPVVCAAMCAAVIRFTASSALPETTDALPGHPLSRVDVTIRAPDLEPDGGGTPQPVVVTTARTEFPPPLF